MRQNKRQQACRAPALLSSFPSSWASHDLRRLSSENDAVPYGPVTAKGWDMHEYEGGDCVKANVSCFEKSKRA